MSTCAGCGAPIVWAVTEAARKAIPLNAAPDPAGNLEMTGNRATTQLGRSGPEVRNIGPPGMLPDERVRYMPHHATCPDVDKFRS